MSQYFRQGQRCYGCLGQLIAAKDYNGALLCAECFAKLDSPQTLRRLMAIQDYQAKKHNVYVIGSLKNEAVPSLANTIRQHPAFDVMDEWYTPGEFADDNWQIYEQARGRPWSEALRSRGCQNIFMFDRAYMDHADTVILVLPCGKSAMCELGYAAGRGKNTIIYLNNSEPERFEIMPNFAQHLVKTEAELMQVLETLSGGYSW